MIEGLLTALFVGAVIGLGLFVLKMGAAWLLEVLR